MSIWDHEGDSGVRCSTDGVRDRVEVRDVCGHWVTVAERAVGSEANRLRRWASLVPPPMNPELRDVLRQIAFPAEHVCTIHPGEKRCRDCGAKG